MIVNAFIAFVVTLVTPVLNLLPAWSPIDWDGLMGGTGGPTGSNATALGNIFKYLRWANWYLPVDTVLTIISLSVTLAVAIYGAKGVLWLLEKLHIAGGAED